MVNITKEMVSEFNNELRGFETKVRLKFRERQHTVLNTIDIKTNDIFQTDRMSLSLTEEFYSMLENFFENKYKVKLNYNNTKSCFWAMQLK